MATRRGVAWHGAWNPIGALMDRDLHDGSVHRGLSICAFTYQRIPFLPVHGDMFAAQLSLPGGNATDIDDSHDLLLADTLPVK